MPLTGRRNGCASKVYSSLAGMTAALERVRIEKREQEYLLAKKESDLVVAQRKLENSRKDNKKLRDRLKELEVRSNSRCKKLLSPSRTPVNKSVGELKTVAEIVADSVDESISLSSVELEEKMRALSVLDPVLDAVIDPIDEPVLVNVEEPEAEPVDERAAETIAAPAVDTEDIPAWAESFENLLAGLQPTPIQRGRNGYLILKTWDEIVAESKRLHIKRRIIEAGQGDPNLMRDVIKRLLLDEELIDFEPPLKDPLNPQELKATDGIAESAPQLSISDVYTTPQLSQLPCPSQDTEEKAPIQLYGPYCTRHTLRVSKLPGHCCQKCNEILDERACWGCQVCARGLHLLCRDY